jgi:hypothetical protein
MRNISFNLINYKSFEKRIKMFLKLNYLLSIHFEFEIKLFQILAWK